METDSLIPTGYKKKLPRGFSYSYSAGEVSALLSVLSVSQLYFSDRATHWHSQWQKAVREQGEVEVVQCCRSDSGEYDVRVYSVPSQTRQLVRSALKDTALPSLRQWIAAKRGNRFSAYFHLADGTVRIETFPA